MVALRGIPLRSSGLSTVSVGTMNVQPQTAVSTTTADRERFLSGGTATVNVPAPTTGTSTGGRSGVGGLRVSPAATGPLQGVTHTPTLATLPNVTPTRAFLQNVRPLLGLPPPRAAIKPLEYSQDQLSVADYEVKNDVFQQISKNGIASFRPEILSVIDFLPLVEKARVLSRGGLERLETTPAGDFFDIQYRGLQLRQETLVRFIRTIERADARVSGNAQIKQELDAIRGDYEKMLQQVERSVKFYSDAIASLELIRNSLNIKTIPVSMFNTRDFLSLDRFFERKMQYSREKYDAFADTKVLSQLLFDFRSMMESYSVSLLNLTDSDRINDFNPVVIDKTYTNADQFTFNIASLRSENTAGINASEPQFFTSFVSSLPENPDDRIKILSILLSKEFRVSKGLGKPETQKTLRDVYGTVPEGNPFDNVIGGIGGTIFEPATGNNSLASILHLSLPGDSQVLPFESKYVDTDDQKTVYVPGSAYFVDSIINISNVQNPAFNSGPYLQFVNDYNNRVLNARKVIEDLFEITVGQSSLGAVRMSDTFMTSVKTAIDGLRDFQSVNADQAIILALFKLANTDNTLKNMLFQFAMLVGMSTNGSSSQKTIFKLLPDELGRLTALSFVRVSSGYNPNMRNGLSELRPYMDKLATDIESKVYTLISRTPNPLQPGDVSPLGPFGQRRPGFTAIATTTTTGKFGTSQFSKPPTAGNTQSSNNGVYNLQVQRGSIARTLMATVSTKQDNTTNLLQEFVSLVDKINTAAQSQGVNNYLLSDQTNRTRFNFLGTSTQMLMFFEMLSAYAKKYAFGSFENSILSMVTNIKVDTIGNKMCYSYLEELTSHTTPQLVAARITKTFQGVTAPVQGTGFALPAGGTVPSINQVFRPITTVTLAPIAATAAPRQQTSVNLLNQASSDIANAFQGSTIFNSLIATNPIEANSLLSVGNNGLFGILATGIPLLLMTSRFGTLRTGLSSIRTKLEDEDKTISNVLHILVVIGQYLSQGANKIQGFFNQQSLKNFLLENSIDDLQLLQNPSQVRMAAYILDLIKDKIPATTHSEDLGTISSNVIISDVITPEEHSAILSYFSQAKFLPENLADKKIKILSVGVPANFSKQLSDRVHIQEINRRTFRDKQFDVISFNVYKRDARFDNIVFKPQRVLFDLSMYQREIDIGIMNVRPLEEFRKALARAKTTDYQNVLAKQTTDLVSINGDPKYAFLTVDERQALVVNQVSSYLLGSYITLLTGMRIYEDEFLLKPYVQGTFTDSRVTDLVFNYLNTIENLQINSKANLQDLLNDPTLNADAKDLLRLISYGSFVFEPDYIRASVLRPKLFDRIVHIPLDIEGFEIDEEATLSTESGKQTFRSTYFQNQIQRVDQRLYLKSRQDGDLVMEDYFVTIEAL